MCTAQRMMQAAALISEYDKLSYLPADGLLALAKRSALPSMVAAVLQEIEAGERPSVADIRRRLLDGKRKPNATAETRKPAVFSSILKAWARLQPADKEVALIALWDMLPAVQRIAVRRLVLAPPASSAPQEKTTLRIEADVVDKTSVVAGERCVEAVAAADLTVVTEADAAAADALWSVGPPINDPVLAADATFAETIGDPLEAAFAALSPEQQAVDRDWVLRRLACNEVPLADASRFLQLFLSASDAEQKTFRARRVAERIPQVA